MSAVTVVEPWLEEPLREFVGESRVLFVLLLNPSGQVLAQHGFGRAVDVMAACALAAAMHATGGALGRELDGRPFRELYHAGRDRQIFLAPVDTARGALVALAVFDATTSLGLVRLYFREMSRRLGEAAPAMEPPPVSLAQNFELELNRNLAVLFGRA